ncbi:hypothetical protein [Nannocystis bainbridge]|uniref:Uncharacterized protein n=1 Tax=Nannocystis bainbridge TaxID=2995303 RepID=A0ABT5E2X6_9BACT|nr:hypothetical protein [Nannocystis bainbridge]MDC0719086.1 hypothetical protein [Nannocystis bainbridge]
MRFHTLLKTACLFTLLPLVACDVADLDAESVRVEHLAEEDVPPPPSALRDAPADEDAEGISLDPSLEVADAGDPSAATCFTGQVQWQDSPSGICGGCLINNAYPGQKYNRYYRTCQNGAWGSWTYYNSPCVDC